MKSFSIAVVAACPFPANHGTPGHIREMSQAIALLGHRVHVVTYPIGQDIKTEGITIHRAGTIFSQKEITVGPTYYKPFLDLFLLVKLCRVIWKEKIDLIHAFNYEGALAGYFAKIITGKPLIYYAINNMIDELPSYNFIRSKRLAIRLADFLDTVVPKMGDYVTALSSELYNFLLQRGVPGDRMSVIPAGVNVAMFEGRDPEVIRKRYNIGPSPLVVYTGTLDNFQRIDLLLKAMRIVVDGISDAVLLIAGNIVNPSDLTTHKNLAIQLGIDKNVIFTDECHLDELPSFLSSADVAVIPRPSCPGFPIKLLNYMAAGKAIVTFEGSAKGLKNMVNAIIIRGDDAEEFGRAIVLLLNDQILAQKLGESAKTTAKEMFEWPTIAKKIENIYKRILTR